jgi:Protein of unknown function (DUF4197)
LAEIVHLRGAAMFLRVVALLAVSICAVAQSPLDRILGRASTTKSAASLPADKITAWLKEALKVSTNKAVASTGRPDGFLKNEAIKILLPPKIQSAGRGLRMVGMGPQLDELEVGMNRAAEQATPQAKQIFLNALLSMNIDDARGILKGGDTAATDFFRNKSTADLTTAFRPLVHQAMMNVGVVKQYAHIAQSPMAAPLVGKFDLDGYVVGKTLDGLFYVLGEEEKKIRTNPAAQTTSLLKEVFGARR